MNRLRTVFLVGVVSATVGGCAFAPEPVYRLKALGGPGTDVAFVDGEVVAAKRGAGVRVAAAFAGEREGMLGIRVEIANEGEDAFTFDPAGASFLPLAQSGVIDAPNWRRVVDPEQFLLSLDLARSREVADKRSAEATGTTFALLGVIGTTASLASGDARRASSSARSTAVTVAHYEHRAASHGAQANAYASSRSFLSNDLLRRSTVMPAQAVAGTILLPPEPTAQRVWIAVRLRGVWFRFPFEQTVYWP